MVEARSCVDDKLPVALNFNTRKKGSRIWFFDANARTRRIEV